MRTRPSIARAAALLAVLTAMSQVLGFVRDAVIAAVYGAGAALDAYLVAQGLMNLVLALVAGAMARAVVPPVSRAAHVGEIERANRTVQTVLTVSALVLVSGAVVMYLAAEVVVTVMAPGFDPETRQTAVEVTRVMLFATVFVAGTDILAAAAQAHGRFFGSGVQGVPFNLVMILAAALFGERYGIEALALGFVVGSAVRMLVQVPAARSFRLRLRPRLGLREADFAEVMRLFPAVLITTAAVNVNTLVDRAVGSAQGEGVIAALSFGWRLVTLVDSLLVVTVVAALYPALSAASRPERRADLCQLVTRAIRVMLVLLIPVVAMVAVASEPLVRLLFGRGDFDNAAVVLTAVAVSGYAASAAAIAVRSIGSRTCLAMGDRRTPVVIAVVVMVVNAVGDLTLGIAFGVIGLAASTSFSLVAGAVAVLVLLHRRHRAVHLGRIAMATSRCVLAATGAIGVCFLLGVTRPSGGDVETFVGLVLMGVTLVTTYVAILMALRSDELRELTQTLREQVTLKRHGG